MRYKNESCLSGNLRRRDRKDTMDENNAMNVIISILGTQINDQNEEDKIELVTDGKYAYERGNIRFSYQESELTGLEGTRTTFCITPENVTMTREGTLNTKMIFEEGVKHHFLYDTPFGALTMGVNTARISYALTAQGGDLEIEYAIDYEHALVGKNNFKINIRQAGRQGSI